MTAAELSCVQRAGGLVGEDHARPVDQGAGDRDALALPAGELVGELVGVIRRGPSSAKELDARSYLVGRAVDCNASLQARRSRPR